jgi:hypothetical protein
MYVYRVEYIQKTVPNSGMDTSINASSRQNMKDEKWKPGLAYIKTHLDRLLLLS